MGAMTLITALPRPSSWIYSVGIRTLEGVRGGEKTGRRGIKKGGNGGKQREGREERRREREREREENHAPPQLFLSWRLCLLLMHRTFYSPMKRAVLRATVTNFAPENVNGLSRHF